MAREYECPSCNETVNSQDADSLDIIIIIISIIRLTFILAELMTTRKSWQTVINGHS